METIKTESTKIKSNGTATSQPKKRRLSRLPFESDEVYAALGKWLHDAYGINITVTDIAKNNGALDILGELEAK